MPDEDGAALAVAEFLAAFENLDPQTFESCFHEKATMFFPHPEPPTRMDSKDKILERFARVFERIHHESAGGPPYHRLEPKDLRVELLADDLALITFHLLNGQRIARRTILMKKEGSRWLIIHVHASNSDR